MNAFRTTPEHALMAPSRKLRMLRSSYPTPGLLVRVGSVAAIAGGLSFATVMAVQGYGSSGAKAPAPAAGAGKESAAPAKPGEMPVQMLIQSGAKDTPAAPAAPAQRPVQSGSLAAQPAAKPVPSAGAPAQPAAKIAQKPVQPAAKDVSATGTLPVKKPAATPKEAAPAIVPAKEAAPAPAAAKTTERRI